MLRRLRGEKEELGRQYGRPLRPVEIQEDQCHDWYDESHCCCELNRDSPDIEDDGCKAHGYDSVDPHLRQTQNPIAAMNPAAPRIRNDMVIIDSTRGDAGTSSRDPCVVMSPKTILSSELSIQNRKTM